MVALYSWELIYFKKIGEKRYMDYELHWIGRLYFFQNYIPQNQQVFWYSYFVSNFKGTSDTINYMEAWRI